jgi:hypothetical protein
MSRKISYTLLSVILASVFLLGCALPGGVPPPPSPPSPSPGPTPAPQPEGPKPLDLDPVIMLRQLNFELADFLGKKVWALGAYADGRFSGDGVGFLVHDFTWLITSERLPDHSFARLDGDLPPGELNGAEVLVFGEVKDFGQTHGKFTLQPTPIITVERYHLISPPVPPGTKTDWRGNSYYEKTLSAIDNFFSTDEVMAQGAATGTRASDCDRALIISGGVDESNNHSRYERGVAAKFKKLKELGFSDDQIDVIYNDGSAVNADGSNIVDGKASNQTIKETIEKYQKEMEASCTLTIMISDHGTGYRPDQGYEGARPSFGSDPGKTYAEADFKVDLINKVKTGTAVVTPDGTIWSFDLNKASNELEVRQRVDIRWTLLGKDLDVDGWVLEDEVELDLDGDGDMDDTGVSEPDVPPVAYYDNEWDTDGDGKGNVRARWDDTGYVFERLKDGKWQEMGRDTNGDHVIDSADGGVDWNLDGDKGDQIGFHEGINLWGSEVLWDDELAGMLQPLHDKGVHILVEMMQCFSGGFIGNLEGVVEKIVTASSEDNKSYARDNTSGGYDNMFQLGFVDGLVGIDVDSWNRAFDNAKKVDTQSWVNDGSYDGTANEYQKWEKPLIQTESTVSETRGRYTLNLRLPQSLQGKVYDMEIFNGLQKPRWEKGDVTNLPEGYTSETIPGGVKIESEQPFPLEPLEFKFRGAPDAESLRIHITDKEHKNLGYISPPLTDPPPVTRTPEVQETATGLGNSLGTEDGEAGSTEDIAEDARLDFIISRLTEIIESDDPEISEETKDDAVTLLDWLERAGQEDQEWLLDFIMEIYLLARESVTVELTIPILMSAQSVANGGCESTIIITYSGTLRGGTGLIEITSVVLKVNGEVWADTGSVSYQGYSNVEEKAVGCGQTFNAEVIVTTSDGKTSSNTASLTTPVP